MLRRSLGLALAGALILVGCGKSAKPAEVPAAPAPTVCAPTDADGCAARCSDGDAASCVNLGVLLERGGDPAALGRAGELYEKACEAGHGVGCSNLGALWLRGNGRPADAMKARTLFEKACQIGHAPEGCANLGFLHEKGLAGLFANASQASIHYEQACDAGSALGCHNLAGLYRTGQGVDQNLVRARKLYDKACSAGFSRSCDRRAQLPASP